MDSYFDLRNLADAYAANGHYSDAATNYEKALQALPRSELSPEQQELIRPLLQRRLDRAIENASQ